MIRIRRTPEADDAVRAARASHVQAQRDLTQQKQRLADSKREIDKLRAHNATNHFDVWIMDLLAKRMRGAR